MNRKSLVFVPAVILAVCMLFCGCGKTDLADDYYANSLPDTIDYVPYFKDGNIYYYKNGEIISVAENAYDETDDSPIYTADYAIDKKSGKMLYLIDDELFLFDGESSSRIARNVTAWRAVDGFEAILFTVPWRENIDSTLGMLFVYRDGVETLLDTGVLISSVQLEKSRAYALKPNVYPKTRNTLIMYDFDGGSTVINDERPQIMYADENCVITAESTDGKLYTYYIDTPEKSVTAEGVYYPSVAGSTLYLLQGYSNGNGALYAYDLISLKSKKLAVNVSFFSTETVTNPKKGVAYSVLDDAEKEYYSVYYCTVNGKSKRIIHNTSEDALSNMALNNDTMNGYVYSTGRTQADSAVYYIDFKDEVTSTRLASGAVGALCYFEREGLAAYVKTDGSGEGVLFVTNGLDTVTLCDNCAVESTSGEYKAQCVINAAGDKALYFSGLEEEECGTLCLSDGTVISESAMREYGSAPITDNGFNEVFYLEKNDDGTCDFYLFNGERVLIDEDVQAIISVS